MIKPTFTDVNGVKVKCSITSDEEFPHLLISVMGDDGTMTPLLELNAYDSKYLASACDNYLKHATALNFTGSLAGLSPDEADDQFGTDATN